MSTVNLTITVQMNQVYEASKFDVAPCTFPYLIHFPYYYMSLGLDETSSDNCRSRWMGSSTFESDGQVKMDSSYSMVYVGLRRGSLPDHMNVVDRYFVVVEGSVGLNLDNIQQYLVEHCSNSAMQARMGLATPWKMGEPYPFDAIVVGAFVDSFRCKWDEVVVNAS